MARVRAKLKALNKVKLAGKFGKLNKLKMKPPSPMIKKELIPIEEEPDTERPLVPLIKELSPEKPPSRQSILPELISDKHDEALAITEEVQFTAFRAETEEYLRMGKEETIEEEKVIPEELAIESLPQLAGEQDEMDQQMAMLTMHQLNNTSVETNAQDSQTASKIDINDVIEMEETNMPTPIIDIEALESSCIRQSSKKPHSVTSKTSEAKE